MQKKRKIYEPIKLKKEEHQTNCNVWFETHKNESKEKEGKQATNIYIYLGIYKTITIKLLTIIIELRRQKGRNKYNGYKNVITFM